MSVHDGAAAEVDDPYALAADLTGEATGKRLDTLRAAIYTVAEPALVSGTCSWSRNWT